MNQLPEGLLLSHPAAEDSSFPEDHGSKHDHLEASLARVALWSLEDRPRPAFSTGWGAADKVEALRARARRRLHRLLGRPPEHHGSLNPTVEGQLPYSRGMSPNSIVEVVEAAGWGSVRLERVRDVEWARAMMLTPL